jgi:hypothetical protein
MLHHAVAVLVVAAWGHGFVIGGVLGVIAGSLATISLCRKTDFIS